MVILGLGACLKYYLEVHRRIRLEMPKLEFFGKFYRGVDFLITGSKYDSENLSTSVMSFMICVQNFR